MADETIDIEVAYAAVDRQMLIPLSIAANSTVAQAISASGILDSFPEIDLERQKVGIFNQICRLDQICRAGNRIEIYRPLAQNPMQARRGRLQKS